MTFDLAYFCEERLGSSPARIEFTTGFLNNVYGVELADGRLVVVKVHPTSVGVEAVVRARHRLTEADVGCPPILDVVDGRVIVEPLVRGGHMPDPHSREGITAMATLLARIVDADAPTDDMVGPPWTDYRHGLYPQPPGPSVDFATSGEGVEWADALATEAANRLCAASGRVVVGHGDFQAQNMRFEGSKPVAVFDWDSLVADLEPAVVGFAAVAFVDLGDPAQAECAAPTERNAFIEAYERKAGHALDRQIVAAASVWLMAYMGRWVHSFYPSEPPYYEGSHLGTLYRHGAAYMEGQL